jgi:uncharacterized membrane protein YecN with MAPEG domain
MISALYAVLGALLLIKLLLGRCAPALCMYRVAYGDGGFS